MTEPPIDPFGEQVRRGIAKAIKNLDADSSPWGEAFGGPPKQEQPTLSAKKYGYLLPVLNETLMDEGLIPDTREPVKVSRYQRARWRAREAVASARLKVGEKIAGVTLDDRDDW